MTVLRSIPNLTLPEFVLEHAQRHGPIGRSSTQAVESS